MNGRSISARAAPALPVYDPDKLLVSVHIPKTAGTSLTTALRTWFGDRLRLHYRNVERPISAADDTPGACVHGHFHPSEGAGVRDYFPHADQFITVMRDPFQRMISLWRFLNAMQQNGNTIPVLEHTPTFDLWFAWQRERAESDPVTRVLAQLPDRVTPSTIQSVFDHGFVAVGVSERFEETLRVFAHTLGRPRVDQIHVNRTRFDDNIDYKSYRSVHEQVFSLEYEAYALAEQRLERQLQAIID
ncbi:sulfotransferase family 2 domain-containing protein [uncultured Brevundimonas sp.]|uniref:sulfotransferase family 2 domain-containing protein n=1 Tax=uncultured Brevundimonas sp. TaxID=213418 RepID=UPI0025F30848|nr:sulfotransferase family 2 domain-containing protein [uncultured Brevundimonas sp.]